MRPIRTLAAGLIVVLLSGCAGYQLGPTGGVGAGEKSVQVLPFTDDTLERRVGDAVSAAVRRSLQRDGTYRLATHGSADVLVSGVLTEYRRHELSFVPRDILTVSDYRVSLTAQVTAREAGSGKVLLDQRVSGYTLVRVGADLTSAERQALPLLAEDLAKNITALLVDGSW